MINKQIVNIADVNLTDYSFLSRYHYTKLTGFHLHVYKLYFSTYVKLQNTNQIIPYGQGAETSCVCVCTKRVCVSNTKPKACTVGIYKAVRLAFSCQTSAISLPFIPIPCVWPN